MTNEQLISTLNLGKISQIGCVVENLSQTIKNYEDYFNIGPFKVFQFNPQKCFVKDRDPYTHLKIGVAQLSSEISLELIEVVSGKPYHKDFLAKYGAGVQHLGFITNEYDNVLNIAKSLNIEVIMSAETYISEMGHVRGAYLDTYDLTGVLFEIIEIRPL